MTLLGCKIFIGDTAESTYPNNTIWKPPQLPYSKVNAVLKKCEDGFCYGICALIRDFNGNSVAAKVEVIVSMGGATLKGDPPKILKFFKIYIYIYNYFNIFKF